MPSARDGKLRDKLRGEPLPFAAIPEWLLHSDVSGQTIRLCCVIQRHANPAGDAWPGRKRLAKLMYKSTGTVDRAIGELVSVGALTVTRRWRTLEGEIVFEAKDGAEATSNLYHLRFNQGLREIRRSAGSPPT